MADVMNSFVSTEGVSMENFNSRIAQANARFAADAAARGAAGGIATLDSAQKVAAAQASAAMASVTASRALTLADAGRFISADSASAITITIPTNAAVAFPVGTEIEFLRSNTGAVTFAAASGVTILSVDGVKTIGNRYGVVCLKKTYTNNWLLCGDLG